MSAHNKIDYLEMPTTNMEATKAFFAEVFEWMFMDHGPEYASFLGEGINGGFYATDKSMSTRHGSALVVLYSKDLEASQRLIEQHCGKITKPTFSFPGGRRFHFEDPTGNEFAVWSE
ncbi:MAG: VOC family protein [Gammaproteobacteria bacterium]|nr:VOC family protein [Gammaproteobacteria bacterium]